MNQKKTIVLLVIGILVATTMSIGVTYSYMKPKADKTNNQTEIGINNCAKITLKDDDSTINLTNMYPMEEEMGLQTEAYEFTISSTCEEYTGFNLYLLTYSDNQINDNNIIYGITSKNDTVLETNLLTSTVEETELTEAEKKEINQGVNNGYSKIYKIYSNNIPLKGESEYKLHIWIDENANNDTMDKNIKLGVIVKGYEREETMAEYLIAHKDNTLIYHDGLPDYEGMENYELEAEDLSYRFSGANPNNYVCLDGKETTKCETDDDLYRIIGLFKNDLNLYEIKLIKAQGATATELGEGSAYGGLHSNTDYSNGQSYYKGTNWKTLAGYYWNNSEGDNSTNMWRYSNLNKENLNNFYYNYIINRVPYLQNMITEHTWITGGLITVGNAKVTYNLELGEEKIKVNDKVCKTANDATGAVNCIKEDLEYSNHIGLMYVSDYMYGTNPSNFAIEASNYENEDVKNNNWLYMGLWEWSISRMTNSDVYVRHIAITGYADKGSVVNKNTDAVRPCFYISSSAKLKSGNIGTSTNPYRLAI